MYNDAAVIGEQLTGVAAQRYDGHWEVIVADNGSTDGSAAIVRSFADRIPGLRIVDASDVRGVSHARNIGAWEATGELILYLDSDDVVTPGWLPAMVRGLEHYDVVGGKFDEETLNDPVVMSWTGRRPTDELKRPFGHLPAVIGGNCGFHASVLKDLGGWNEDYLYAEDIELSWRAVLAGYRLGFVADALVQYRLRSTLKGLWKQNYFRGKSGHPLLSDFRDATISRLPTVGGKATSDALWLIANLPLMPFSRTRRGRWVQKAGYGAGLIVGRWQQRRRPGVRRS